MNRSRSIPSAVLLIVFVAVTGWIVVTLLGPQPQPPPEEPATAPAPEPQPGFAVPPAP